MLALAARHEVPLFLAMWPLMGGTDVILCSHSSIKDYIHSTEMQKDMGAVGPSHSDIHITILSSLLLLILLSLTTHPIPAPL